MNEVVVVPTYNRPEFLYCCLSRIRKVEPSIPVLVFPDRGTWKNRLLLEICHALKARVVQVPEHDYYGNSYNALEALRFAYNAGADLTYYVEDDVMIHDDFFSWHRRVHEDYDDIFGAMAWIFNRYAPIEDADMFQPWYYAIGTSFTRKKLLKIVEHATPLYYADMQGYILKHFSGSALNASFGIAHYEQDGIIQRVLIDDNTQVVSPGIARCSHIGLLGYNQGWEKQYDFYFGCKTLKDRIDKIESFLLDEHWRADIFGRELVSREVGHEIDKRVFDYSIKLPNGWETTFKSELSRASLPRKIRSVVLPREAEIVVHSS